MEGMTIILVIIKKICRLIGSIIPTIKKIEWVQNSFFMGRHKKQYKIAQLQAKRDYEIGCVVAKFNGGNNHYSRNDNHYNHDDRRNW